MDTPSTPINPLDNLLEHIATAIEQWKIKNSPEVIREQVHKQLDGKSNEVMLQLLGFRDTWGKWEISSNPTNSPAQNFLAAAQQKAIEEWLKSAAMPSITPAMQKRMTKTIREVYENQITYKLREMVELRAKSDLADLLSKLIPPKNLENYQKTLALLRSIEEVSA